MGQAEIALRFICQRTTAAIVASTYCNSWIFDEFDENDPFESTALAYTKIFINRSEKAKMEYLKSWIDEFKIVGVIFHDSKTSFQQFKCPIWYAAALKRRNRIANLSDRRRLV